MSKHMTLSDRAIIEKYIALDMSFAYIARRLNRSATTISREVMDTVKGARGSQKVLLTMILRDTNFMLIFLLPDGTQTSVLATFDKLTLLLGIETFRKIFPVILTDSCRKEPVFVCWKIPTFIL